ncbi:hypothetical protein [Sulfurimonas sp.]|uniref:hypothetical protein n=1 Tax=Sulfurimonas sp. TaxID=2022749 RepID=UPI00286E379F|nr:hypothetical protein [Sulfurimonas sp.]
MKTFLIILTFFIFFTGCSSKNAFDKFKMDKAQELSVSSLQSSKVLSKDGEISGVFSAIYLNEVYPESFNQDEYFFVFLYIKEAKEMYDPENPTDTDLKLKLNSQLPVKIEKLPDENKFSHLADTKSNWNQYYIVTFKKASTINLVLENGNSSSAILKYKKDYP